MDNLLIENILNNFISHLKKIGLLTKFDITYFKTIFNSKHNNNSRYFYKANNNPNNAKKLNSIINYLSQILPEVIISFFNYISTQNKKSIAKNLYQKFANAKENIINNKLFHLILIYYNNKLRLYLNKWKLDKRNYFKRPFLDESLNYNNIFTSNNNNHSHINMIEQYQNFNNNAKNIQKNNIFTFKNLSTLKLNQTKNLVKPKNSKFQEKYKKKFQKNISNHKSYNSSQKNIFNRNNSILYENPKFGITNDNIHYKYYNKIENLYKEEQKKFEKKLKIFDTYELKEITFKTKNTKIY